MYCHQIFAIIICNANNFLSIRNTNNNSYIIFQMISCLKQIMVGNNNSDSLNDYMLHMRLQLLLGGDLGVCVDGWLLMMPLCGLAYN